MSKVFEEKAKNQADSHGTETRLKKEDTVIETKDSKKKVSKVTNEDHMPLINNKSQEYDKAEEDRDRLNPRVTGDRPLMSDGDN
jgi:hypothetical protein